MSFGNGTASRDNVHHALWSCRLHWGSRKSREETASCPYLDYTEIFSSGERLIGPDGTLIEPQRKIRRRSRYDHEQAWSAIQQDGYGPLPVFDDCQFHWVFRVTKAIAKSYSTADLRGCGKQNCSSVSRCCKKTMLLIVAKQSWPHRWKEMQNWKQPMVLFQFPSSRLRRGTHCCCSNVICGAVYMTILSMLVSESPSRTSFLLITRILIISNLF